MVNTRHSENTFLTLHIHPKQVVRHGPNAVPPPDTMGSLLSTFSSRIQDWEIKIENEKQDKRREDDRRQAVL